MFCVFHVTAFCCGNHEDKRAKDHSVDLCVWENGMLYRLYSIFVHLFLILIDLPCSRFNAASMLSYFRCVLELRVNIFRSWLRER